MRFTSSARFAVGVAVGVLTLAACSASGGTDKSSSGLDGGDSPATVETVKIGFQGPLSGDYEQLGLNEFNAIKLAVDDANKNNTFGFKVELVQADDQGDPSKAPAAAATLIQDPAVVGMIGPAFSGSVNAAGAPLSAAGLAFITPSATNATLQDAGFTAFHRMVPSDNVEGTRGAAWLARKGLKRVFVVDDLGDYGKGVADAVEAELKKDGVEVERQGVDAKTTDYGVVANAVQSSGAEAVFYGGYDAQAALFAKALKSAGFTGLTLTGNGGKSTVFTSASGGAGDGWYFLCGCLDAATAPAAQAFTAEYRAAFNEPPSTFSPESYDATNALLTAIKAAADKGSLTRESVAAEVAALNYAGISTQIKFESNGDLAASVATVNLYQQVDGKFVQIGNVDDQN
jgi:branched-chain amino acid transport system substrate-binding protein